MEALTQDGLEPGRTSLVCHGAKGKIDMDATADLVATRGRLWRRYSSPGPGLCAKGCSRRGVYARGLPERCAAGTAPDARRGASPDTLSVERRRRIEAVLPPAGEPRAPPGRCATLWPILAEALENGHDAAGAELIHERTETG